MIEVSGISLPASSLAQDGRAIGADEELRLAMRHALRRLGIENARVASAELRRRSIDARKRNDVRVIFSVRITLAEGDDAEAGLVAALSAKGRAKDIRLVEEERMRFPAPQAARAGRRIVVVGAGCAGLFCALALADAGFEPLLIERGDDASRRTSAVRDFIRTRRLDPESNIQFGLGGAGTFSDGKLTTGTKSPYHRLILETFVECGADPSILFDSHPHIGSDVLPKVVGKIREKIEERGGAVRFRCRLAGIDLAGSGSSRRVSSVTLENTDGSAIVQERIDVDDVVLATGHSARDVFSMLAERGVVLERKPFAMGLRIEHLQADVNAVQYGPQAQNPALGAAPYKLAEHLGPDSKGLARSAFSFCMCPGGTVVAAASELGSVVTNGMSEAARDGVNANSGLLANVYPEDLPGDDPLAGIALQMGCEQRAFQMGGADYSAPAQLVADYLAGVASTGPGRVKPSYPLGVVWGELGPCLPPFVDDTLRRALPRMAKRLRFFADGEAVLTGVESRSSSPVRVTRDASLSAAGIEGLWPAGEGAGYAGGIMSAATDGLRVAEALMASER